MFSFDFFYSIADVKNFVYSSFVLDMTTRPIRYAWMSFWGTTFHPRSRDNMSTSHSLVICLKHSDSNPAKATANLHGQCHIFSVNSAYFLPCVTVPHFAGTSMPLNQNVRVPTSKNCSRWIRICWFIQTSLQLADNERKSSSCRVALAIHELLNTNVFSTDQVGQLVLAAHAYSFRALYNRSTFCEAMSSCDRRWRWRSLSIFCSCSNCSHSHNVQVVTQDLRRYEPRF